MEVHMNELKIFENSEFGALRGVEINGESWLVGKDVAERLGYKDTADALKRHVDEEDKLTRCFTDSGQSREMYVINESGFYSLVLGSKLPNAKKFKRWVTSEVLPAIRQTGGYIAGEESLTDDELLARALKVMQAKLDQREARIAGLTAENSKLIVSNQTMLPKAEYFDELVDRNLLTSFRETAKELKVKERAFVGFLLEKKYVYRDKKGKLMPYEAKNNGLFEIKECTNDKTAWSGTQTLITPKGRETFRLLTQGL